MLIIVEDRNDEEIVKYSIRVLTENTNGYDIKERSKGFQWSFCFTTLTEIKKYKNKNGFIFLLDEPASNLHIASQNDMLKEMSNLCEGKNIAIYSTHAPDLIDTDNLHNLLVVKNNAQEFEDTNIILSKYIDDKFDKSITTTDIEPIIVNLAYQGVKNIKVDEKNNPIWKEIISFVIKIFTSEKLERAINNFLKLSQLFEKIS